MSPKDPLCTLFEVLKITAWICNRDIYLQGKYQIWSSTPPKLVLKVKI